MGSRPGRPKHGICTGDRLIFPPSGNPRLPVHPAKFNGLGSWIFSGKSQRGKGKRFAAVEGYDILVVRGRLPGGGIFCEDPVPPSSPMVLTPKHDGGSKFFPFICGSIEMFEIEGWEQGETASGWKALSLGGRHHA